jgi:hypothetical protein
MQPTIFDILYPSALSRSNETCGYILANLSEKEKYSFQNHFPILFLPLLDRTEIQRAASQKIPCMVSVHSLQNAFDVFKHPNVKFVHVPFSDKPIIDVGWMGKAKEDGTKTVVFSILEWKETVANNKTRILEEYLKMIRLLVKWKIPVLLASFAKDENEIPTLEEKEALSSFLGVYSKPKALEINSPSEG